VPTSFILADDEMRYNLHRVTKQVEWQGIQTQ
jgi:hypothetical protein